MQFTRKDKIINNRTDTTLTTLVRLTALLWLLASGVWAEHSITDVAVSQRQFDPVQGELQFSWKTSKPAMSKFFIYNEDADLVRTFVSEERKSEHQLTWDGTDEQGAAGAEGFYLFRIETEDEEAFPAAHDPHLREGGQDAIVYAPEWNEAEKTLRFSLFSPALVRTRVGG